MPLATRSSPRLGGLVLSLLPAGALLAAACGGYASTGPVAPPDAQSVLASASLQFTPATLMVHPGDDVTFVFGSVAHNVYFDATPGAPGDIGGANAATSVTRRFETAGTYHFTCHIHPSMEGTIQVVAGGSSSYQSARTRQLP
jgi:plastocyanin